MNINQIVPRYIYLYILILLNNFAFIVCTPDTTFETRHQNVHAARAEFVQSNSQSAFQNRTETFLNPEVSSMFHNSTSSGCINMTLSGKTVTLWRVPGAEYAHQEALINDSVRNQIALNLMCAVGSLLDKGVHAISESLKSRKTKYDELFDKFCRINYTREQLKERPILELQQEFYEVHHVDVVRQNWDEIYQTKYASLDFAQTENNREDAFLKSYENFCHENYTPELFRKKMRMECFLEFCEYNNIRLYVQEYWGKEGKLKYAGLKFNESGSTDLNSFQQSFEQFCKDAKIGFNTDIRIECFKQFCEFNDRKLYLQDYWEKTGKIEHAYLQFDKISNAEAISFLRGFEDFCKINAIKTELNETLHLECFTKFCEIYDVKLHAQNYWEQIGKLKYASLKFDEKLDERVDFFVKSFEEFCKDSYEETLLSKEGRLECFKQFCEFNDVKLYVKEYWNALGKFKYAQLKNYKTPNVDADFFLKSFEQFCEKNNAKAKLYEISLMEWFSEFCRINDTRVYIKKCMDQANSFRRLLHTPNDVDDSTIILKGSVSVDGGSCFGGNIPGSVGQVVQGILFIKQCVDLYLAGGGGGGGEDKNKKEKEEEQKKYEEDRRKFLLDSANENAFINGACLESDSEQKINLPPVDPQLKYPYSPLQRWLDLSSSVPGSDDRLAVVQGQIIRFTRCNGMSRQYLEHQLNPKRSLHSASQYRPYLNYKASVVQDLSTLSDNEKEVLSTFWCFNVKKKLKDQKKQAKRQQNNFNQINYPSPGQDPKDPKNDKDKNDQKKCTNGIHESNPKHHQNAQKGIGREPARPVEALQNSLYVDETTRVAIQDGEIVIFRKHGETVDGISKYHSYIENDIHRVREVKKVLEKLGLIHPKSGKVLKK
jgi:hypothetical protein